jgi:hypothetical protein
MKSVRFREQQSEQTEEAMEKALAVFILVSLTACGGSAVQTSSTIPEPMEQKVPDNCSDPDLVATYHSFSTMCADMTIRPQRRMEICRASEDMQQTCGY